MEREADGLRGYVAVVERVCGGRWLKISREVVRCTEVAGA